MDAQLAREQSLSRITLHRLGAVAWSSIEQDVRAGLTLRRKRLPPKYFYDERGSLLFERICETEEYYPTRTENRLLHAAADDVIARVRPVALVELGSGSSRKTVHLLDACQRQRYACRYLPIDVCGEMLMHAGASLCARYPWLEIEACVADYGKHLSALPPVPAPRLFAFLGGTIGNLDDNEGTAFLRELRAVMTPDDRLLLGADRVKSTAVLNAAYNDAQGHTAAFNLNMLRVINRELHAEFDPDRFVHRAWYNEQDSQVEMHLEALEAHIVPVHKIALRAEFAQGETILTEISRKFTPASLAALLDRGGFTIESHYEPDDACFSLVLARPL